MVESRKKNKVQNEKEKRKIEREKQKEAKANDKTPLAKKKRKTDIVSETNVFSKLRYVVVKYEGEYFSGQILDLNDNEIQVKTMALSGIRKYKWPKEDDILWYPRSDVVEIIHDIGKPVRGQFDIPEMHK